MPRSRAGVDARTAGLGAGQRGARRVPPLAPEGRDLLVHLVFDEAEGAGLRVEWQRDGHGAPEIVAENLGRASVCRTSARC